MADFFLLSAKIYFVYCEVIILFVGLTGKLRKNAIILRAFL